MSEKEKIKENEEQVSASLMERVFNPPSAEKPETTSAEDIALIIREWLAKKHIQRKTRYSKRQVNAVSILQSLANTYNIKTLKRFLREFQTAKLSEEGKSSAELENILKARMPLEEKTELQKLSKFLE